MVSRINRRTILKLSICSLIFLSVFGCSKTPNALQDSTPKTIFFSTNAFKFYDLGFVKSYPNHTTLEIFNAGIVLLKMDCYKDKICLNTQCYAKDSVMRKFFGNDAFRELDFNAILKGQEIFSGENKRKIQNGFEQNIMREGMELNYNTTQDSIELEIKDLQKKTIFSLAIH
ncbi:hypothetical protein LS70_002130 [Helicobacter sp. MIT 11-5569]|uniref:hypothetical protein n=1 Tax=Helicobacter sp. MIT 11-5569 TaxID=1548151 RepID=UPI00051FBE94|nr:hypothetical protein [Helicobacter sp. MIT 11-5569]TLD85363.1 hypothetical protein LS70_002130 [Helicobacter sp. MIT 11-5569]